jgi:3',5'-cyclic AMP phosphodiesterase CpdA
MKTTRRDLLGVVAATMAAPALTVGAASSQQRARASEEAQRPDGANTVAILNDTHIAEGHADDHVHPRNLRLAIDGILALTPRPAAVVINGDLAMSVGTPGDYRRFRELIEPLRRELPLHLTLGNHDTREEFLRAFPELTSASQLREHRHTGILDLPHVRLALLDSLKETPAAPGRLGADQIRWMLEQADAVGQNKPFVCISHHNPRVGGDAVHFPGGIEDTEAFWPELVARPQCKAFFHGHVHDWTLGMHTGIHVVNTMASAMVADTRVSTNGWTLARFATEGVEIEIHTYQADHAWNGERKWLFWRQPRV